MFQRFRFYKIDILLWFITWLFFLKESIVETTGCSLFRLVQCGWSCNNTFENQFKGFAIGWSRTKKSVTPYHKPIYIIYNILCILLRTCFFTIYYIHRYHILHHRHDASSIGQAKQSASCRTLDNWDTSNCVPWMHEWRVGIWKTFLQLE